MDVWKGALEGLEVTKSFWAGKRVFITGHTGFKGSWLSYWLLRLGSEVSGYSLAPHTRPSLFAALSLGKQMTSELADVGDAQRLNVAMQAARPEIVFHLAAQALVYESYRQPFDTYRTNALGTAHVLEAVRGCPSVHAAIVVTSDKCYDLRAAHERYAEEDALGGHDAYSSSKACAEVITAAYRASFFSQPSNASTQAAVASARAGNVFGGGDWSPHRLIPDAIAAFQTGVPLRVRSPNSIRPWQYVLDPLRGYLLLAQNLLDSRQAYAKAWNFGPPQSHELSVGTIADMVAAAWGAGARWETSQQAPEFHESSALRLDSDRAHHELGWAPRADIAGAIEETVRWHRDFQEDGRADAIVNGSLDRYESAG